MKVVLGIDPNGLYRETVCLLGRLKFKDCNVVAAHVRRPVMLPAYAGGLPASTVGLEAEVRRRSDEWLADAESAASSRVSGSVVTLSLEGSASEQIMQLADVENADLVAIGSRRHGAFESMIMGSMGRSLAIGSKHSFLIARGGVIEEGNVRAVFATDHSSYADRCLEEFLRLDPKGLAEIEIVFATDRDMDRLREAAGLPQAFDLCREELLERVKKRGDALVAKCVASGRRATYNIVEDHAIEALRKGMLENKADLLVLGAQGHGFLSRLLIGSLSLHVVVAESFSVMVIRVPGERT